MIDLKPHITITGAIRLVLVIDGTVFNSSKLYSKDQAEITESKIRKQLELKQKGAKNK